jgi:hypothetical protein
MRAQGLRERIERVAAAPGGGFDNGLFRIIVESVDPGVAAREGPVEIVAPRTSRLIDPHGPGRPATEAGRAG